MFTYLTLIILLVYVKKKIIFFILLLLPMILNADIVYLKNGKVYTGMIVRQTLTKIELQLPNKQLVFINKDEIKKIVYISKEEIQKQKAEQQKMRLEALKKEQEELQRRIEEEKRLQEEKRIQELQRQQEELQKKLEEEKRLQEQQELEENLLQQETQLQEIQEEQKKHKLHLQFGVGLGSFSTPLNQFYEFYNIFSAYSQIINSLYNQNLKIQMKPLPNWNWAGNLHTGISYYYKDWEGGLLITGNYQKTNPKFIFTPNNTIFATNNEPQYESYSENRFQQKKYSNLSSIFFLKIGTSEYFDFFWNYIFPFLEIGYWQRNLDYQSKSSSTLITSIRNTFTNKFEFSNAFITDTTLKNQLKQEALSVGIPFRFLMIFSSEFLLEFHIFLLGKSQLYQTIYEHNIYNITQSNLIFFKSDFTGTFKGNKISFLWQNKYSSNGMVYMRLSNMEYQSNIKDFFGYSILLLPKTDIIFMNPILLFSNPALKLLDENSTYIELGIKLFNFF